MGSNIPKLSNKSQNKIKNCENGTQQFELCLKKESIGHSFVPTLLMGTKEEFNS